MNGHVLATTHNDDIDPSHPPGHPSQWNDGLETVLAEAKIRELRWSILFAQSEPEFFPYLDRDPDTGLIEIIALPTWSLTRLRGDIKPLRHAHPSELRLD